jgi:hypothetical protein
MCDRTKYINSYMKYIFKKFDFSDFNFLYYYTVSF